MKRKFLLALLGGMSMLCLQAQVRGKVVEISEKGDTTVVPGVILRWENTNVFTNSDENGDFNIPVSSTTKKLLINSVGYQNKSATISDTSHHLLLTLKSGIELNEVEVVYYTNGTEIAWLNPIKMEILTERSLMKAACCNLSESFETNPSIDVNFSDAVSGTKQIQMLGLGGQYAQITKENMPYMRGLAGNYGLTFIPGTWIQSIQLSKGAGSVVNGYESFTGQINTELQHPANSDRLHFNSYVNENGRNEYNLNLSQKIGKKWAAGLLSHVSYNPLLQDMNHDGFADIPAGNQYNFMNKYSYMNPKTGLESQFGGTYLKDTRNGGQVPGRAHAHHDTMPDYLIGINNEKWEVFAKTGYVFHKKPGTSVGTQFSYLDHKQDNFFGTNTYTGDQKTFYANFIYQGIINNTNNNYKIGLSYMDDAVTETFGSWRFKRHEQVAGAFAEFAKNYKDKFNLVAGIRADQHNYYGLFFTPRLHLRYAPKPQTVFRLSGGRALRTANIFTDNANLMASSRTWIVVTENNKMPYGLNPETGWNYGLNFTQKFKVNYRDAYVTLDVYRTDFTQQVVVDMDMSTRYVTIFNLRGPSYSNTLQFELNMEPKKRFFIKSAYRFVDTKVQYVTGLLLKPMVSQHRAFLNLSYETRDNHWQFDFTTQYNGAKRLPQTLDNPAEYRRANWSPDYFNLMGQITWLKKIKAAQLHIYLGVENLLNYKQTNPIVAADTPYSRYFDASMVWGPIYGRMLYAGLRFKIK